MFDSYRSANIEFALGESVSNEGRNSEVFMIQDKHLDATLVAKRIARNSLVDLELYFAESRILYQSRHSNVVPVHYACYDDDHVFIVMPYYRNGSLKRALDLRFLTVREIVKYATQFLSGLNNIHANGHIHFDIKPDNILLSDRQEAMVSDFGLSRPTNEHGHASPPQLYSLHTPPEVILDQPLTRRSDVYSVGLTLYRMCNGNSAFHAQSVRFRNAAGEILIDEFCNAILEGKFPNRSQYLPHIPVQLRNTITKCLLVDASLRYNSVFEIINAIAGIDGNALDWQYEKNDAGQLWSKSTDNNYFSLRVDLEGKSEARKRSPNADQHIPEFCQSSIALSSIKKFLGSY